VVLSLLGSPLSRHLLLCGCQGTLETLVKKEIGSVAGVWQECGWGRRGWWLRKRESSFVFVTSPQVPPPPL